VVDKQSLSATAEDNIVVCITIENNIYPRIRLFIGYQSCLAGMPEKGYLQIVGAWRILQQNKLDT
jgi:hypothetical protein